MEEILSLHLLPLCPQDHMFDRGWAGSAVEQAIFKGHYINYCNNNNNNNNNSTGENGDGPGGAERRSKELECVEDADYDGRQDSSNRRHKVTRL